MTEDLGLYYKDNEELVNNFYPKSNGLRPTLWKGQSTSLDDGLEEIELARSLFT